MRSRDAADISPAPVDLPLMLALARLSNGISPASRTQAGTDWFTHLAASPSKQAELAASAVQKWLTWCSGRGAPGDYVLQS